MKLAFTQAAIQSRGENIYLVTGGVDNTGQHCWYFVRVDSPKSRAFLKAISGGTIELESFGAILESGYGKEPPYSVLERMRVELGYKG